MNNKHIMTALLSAAVLTATASTACAESPAGSVVFYADKATLGQGLVVPPVQVEFYNGDKGIDIIKRAADVIVTKSDYGAYITAFADTDTGESVPAEISAVVPDMFGRTAEGYLSAYDYTAESGWNYFLNGESAYVGISDYEPADGDVITFRFSVYGYGSDLGIDNSSWGGAPALVESVNTAELATLLATSTDKADTDAYKAALEALGTYGISQSEIDDCAAALSSADIPASEDNNKTSPDTGTEGLAVVLGGALLGAAALYLSHKKA